jgi:16S rRNA (adenine1518-N6/adenine1519-N6)-dimethyltransferase
MNRLDPQVIKARLQEAGIWSKKSFGQHFLIDEEALSAMVAAADILPGERVIEIGPGPGVLTERLLDAGAAVTAFEADSDMVKILREDFPELHLVEGDALVTVPEHLHEQYKVVANIPYQITTPLIRLFLESGHRLPESLTMLVQKEVGERLAASPRTGERGFLSVLVQYYADVSLVWQVPSSSFWPAPQVDSVVIHMAVKPVRPLEDEKEFFKYVKRAFLEPRKQLKNVLAGIRGVSNADISKTLSELGFPENIRAQELTEADWVKLFQANV